MMTDSQLIHEIAHGNNSAFTELYETYRKEFVGYIRMSFKGDEDTIFDLYQDSCVALYKNIQTNKLSVHNLSVKLKTYLFTIGRNKLVDLYRRSDFKGRKHFIENFDYSNDYDSEYSDECSEREAIVRQAVNAMTEPCNSILTLYYWDEKSIKEIAEIQNTPNPDATKMQKSRCMSKLKAYIKTLLT